MGRLGDPTRFHSLAGARSFSGLVPSLDAYGQFGTHGGSTRCDDAVLREALFMAADQARRQGPIVAARYHRLMATAGKHHNSALGHIAATLLTRIIACWSTGQPYHFRDLDGREVTLEQARVIMAQRCTVSVDTRRQR